MNQIRRTLSISCSLIALGILSWASCSAAYAMNQGIKLPSGVPKKVAFVLRYVDKHDKAPERYVGGRYFMNRERKLPIKDGKGKLIKYREWDVNPKVRGKNRGAQRLVTGSDGSAYYSGDHYKTFKKIR